MMVISMQWSRCSMRATLAACTENLTGWHCADSSLMIGDEPSPLASVTVSAASGQAAVLFGMPQCCAHRPQEHRGILHIPGVM